ncbi:hypothetical protein WR25_02911 [Diploscapter pachys]|uniref:BPTI/Kunitz inhibitor domain-containing protein n=1 Tax=Diploscapter pachys TaxID=2018661 RepID=A0A2A2JGB6_9BILA|nr:hypothetical protein WR25_02911 [Diploscapter pachys]
MAGRAINRINYKNRNERLTQNEVNEMRVQRDMICNQMRDPGYTCSSSPPFPLWYYDGNLRTCQSIQFNGCGGNSNLFTSNDQCMQVCQGAAVNPYGGQIGNANMVGSYGNMSCNLYMPEGLNATVCNNIDMACADGYACLNKSYANYLMIKACA